LDFCEAVFMPSKLGTVNAVNPAADIFENCLREILVFMFLDI